MVVVVVVVVVGVRAEMLGTQLRGIRAALNTHRRVKTKTLVRTVYGMGTTHPASLVVVDSIGRAAEVGMAFSS